MAYKKPYVDIDHRNVAKSRIYRIGIELEGAWKEPPSGVKWVGDRPPSAGQLGRDGSLDPFTNRLRDEAEAKGAPCETPYVGELPSEPLKESEVKDWLAHHFPQRTGPECGMHIHISLVNPLLYMWLMDEESYPATVVEYYRRWAEKEGIDKADPIWDRLAGKSPYCQLIHWPSEQVKNVTKDYVKTRTGHRYTAINFCYGRETGTIECRLLSMPKDAAQANRAVEEFISITNRYLVATAKRERKVVAAPALDPSEYNLTLRTAL